MYMPLEANSYKKGSFTFYVDKREVGRVFGKVYGCLQGGR